MINPTVKIVYSKGIYTTLKMNKPHYVFEKRDGDKIYNLKMVCKDGVLSNENYELFKKKIIEKYPDYKFD